MPALGFDAFLGRETLGGSRRPPYRSDPDLARQVLAILDAEGPRTFIFRDTMGNHGPWPEDQRQMIRSGAGFSASRTSRKAAHCCTI